MLQRLPADVFHNVIELLAVEDIYPTRRALAQLRRCCQSFATLIAPYCFKTVPLWMSVKSLQNLNSISQNAHL